MRKYLFCLFITISVLLTTGCDQAPSTTPLIIPPSTTEPPATTAPETPAETTPQTPETTTPETPTTTTPTTTQQQYVWLCVREEQHEESDFMGSQDETDTLITTSYDYYRNSTDYKCRAVTHSNNVHTQNNTSTTTIKDTTTVRIMNGNQANATITGSQNQNGTTSQINETIAYTFVPGSNGLISLSAQSSNNSSSFSFNYDTLENDESGSTYKIIQSEMMYSVFKIKDGKYVFIKYYSVVNGQSQLAGEKVYSESSNQLIREIGLQNYSETLPSAQYTYTVTSSTDTIADITLLRDGNVYKTLRYEKRPYPFEN